MSNLPANDLVASFRHLPAVDPERHRGDVDALIDQSMSEPEEEDGPATS